MKHDDSSSSGSPARATGTPGPTQAQLKVRVRRLEVLRGAARAITPSIAGQPTTSPFDGTELAAQLALLAQRVAALEECDDAGERDSERRSITRTLAEIDQGLGAAGLKLLRMTDGIALVQLRASLPGIARQRRFGIVDRLVLAHHAAQLARQVPRPRLLGRIAHDLVGLHGEYRARHQNRSDEHRCEKLLQGSTPPAAAPVCATRR